MDPNDIVPDPQTTSTPEPTPAGDETVVDVSPSSSDGDTLLDAITKAAERPSSSDEPSNTDPAAPQEAAEPSPEPTAEAQPAPEEDPGDELPDEPTEAELKAMSARTKRRIEKLLAERREARQEAEKSRPIVEYMRRNDIPMQDVDVVLGLAAQLRHGDFAGFLRTVDPYVKLARQYVGELLPQDLQQQVDQGFVSEAVARELAARRAQGQVLQQQAQRANQAREAEVRDLRGQAIRTAVAQWENSTKQADPDFEAKADVVRRTVQAMIAERGAPQTPEAAVAFAKEAYDEANRVVSRFQPRVKPTAPQPSSVHQTSKSPTPEPSSMLDAIKQAVGE